MSLATGSIETLAINTIRTLSMDGVQAANSGHPGTPMALAPVAYSVWQEALSYDPNHPRWPARDRFVLSCGHASMLLYSVLHVAGVKKIDAQGEPTAELSITLDDLKNFRQLDSPCAGHPEFGEAEGIETTTGPLGQGISNSVGMAIAAKWFESRYDRPGSEIFGFDTYALCSDGDLMEGIGCEAASLAGHLKLDNLCWIYDDNKITIEGETDLAFSEDMKTKFQGLGWHTVTVEDANDLDSIKAALDEFKTTSGKPTLVILKSIIGYGSPNKANTHGAHGAPLGDEEIKLTKEVYGWPNEKFLVPQEVPEHFAQKVGTRGAEAYAKWKAAYESYAVENPELANELEKIWSGELPSNWEAGLPEFAVDEEKGMATRASSGKTLNGFGPAIPWFIGGSADLAPSTKTLIEHDGAGEFGPENYGGRNFHFGIREHAMAAACNGMALCGLRPYGATFFVFTDYMRGSMRLSSLMKLGVTYVLTHDSIGVGEDGPTHQPVEHLAACRSIPGLLVMRPGDANEVAQCYRIALNNPQRPSAMVLTRQNVPTFDRSTGGQAEATQKGGYVLYDCDGTPDVILLGTGSELGLCVSAHRILSDAGVKSRVVSMPCWELFDEQECSYKEAVLPEAVTHRIAVEAGIRMGWDKYIGAKGKFIGMDSFGASAPYTQVYEHFGITVDAVIEAAKSLTGN
ncbi:MAG: transketolase [Planctomycetota bacterium]|nr:transketolase [Planctomycetota bacterium]